MEGLQYEGTVGRGPKILSLLQHLHVVTGMLVAWVDKTF